MFEIVAALRELFRAKAGTSSPEFSSGDMSREIRLSQSGQQNIRTEVQHPGEVKKMEEGVLVEDEVEKPEGRTSLKGLHYAADEFFDVPESTEYDQFENEWPSDMSMEQNPTSIQHPKLSSAAVVVKRLHDLRVQKKGCTDLQEVSKENNVCPSGATLQTDPSCALPCSWGSPDPSSFLIRWPNYLQDRQKIKAKCTLMQLVGVDWLRSDKREDDISSRYGSIVQAEIALLSSSSSRLLSTHFDKSSPPTQKRRNLRSQPQNLLVLLVEPYTLPHVQQHQVLHPLEQHHHQILRDLRPPQRQKAQVGHECHDRLRLASPDRCVCQLQPREVLAALADVLEGFVDREHVVAEKAGDFQEPEAASAAVDDHFHEIRDREVSPQNVIFARECPDEDVETLIFGSIRHGPGEVQNGVVEAERIGDVVIGVGENDALPAGGVFGGAVPGFAHEGDEKEERLQSDSDEHLSQTVVFHVLPAAVEVPPVVELPRPVHGGNWGLLDFGIRENGFPCLSLSRFVLLDRVRIMIRRLLCAKNI